MSFFAGKLPQAYSDEDYYDTGAIRLKGGQRKRNMPLWALSNPESPRASVHKLMGRNIVEGFRNNGFATLGSGAMNWFNPKLPAGKYLSDPFEFFKFFVNEFGSSHECADYQIAWAIETINKLQKPYFLFLNFGETHHKFQFRGCSWYNQGNPYGDHEECIRRQSACLEYLDDQVRTLFDNLDTTNCDIVITSDHGEALGEDGLWGHGFCHSKVMEVPLLVFRNNKAKYQTSTAGLLSQNVQTGAKRRAPDLCPPKFLGFCWGNDSLAKGFQAFTADLRARTGAESIAISNTIRARMLLEEHGLTAFSLEELIPLALNKYQIDSSPEVVKELTAIDRIRFQNSPPYGNIGRMAQSLLGGDPHTATTRAVLAAYTYLIDKIAPDAVFTWNGALLIQKGLAFVAQKMGIPPFYMERGLLPGTFFIDPQGVNFSSSLSSPAWNGASKESLEDALRGKLQIFCREFVTQGTTIVSSGKTMSGKEARKHLGLSNEETLLLLPLQIETDTNIVLHSPYYKQMADIVSDLAHCLKDYEHVRIVAKAHPEDSSENADATRAACGDKIIFSNDMNLIPLLEAADGLITVNSTTGFEMLLRGKPVLCLGNAMYTGKGFTFDLHSKEDLGQLFANFLEATRRDSFKEKPFLTFLHHVLSHSLFALDRKDTWGGNAKIAETILHFSRLQKRDPL